VPEAPAGSEPDWERLDWRLLLISPFSVLRQFAVPAFIAIIGISSSQGGFQAWLLIPALLGGATLGVVPWLTTGYRFTPSQFQIKKGLLGREVQTAPLDRIRSVDLESSVLHRLLGITKVKVGTGVDDTQLELSALSVSAAGDLRHRLLRRTAAAAAPATTDGDEVVAGTPEPPAEVLARLDPSWVRFAPFSLSRLVVVAGVVGFLSQFVDDLPFLDQEHLGQAWDWARGFALWLVVFTITLTAFLGWLVISIAGYVVQWFGLRLAREHGNLHLTAGLLTTRSTTVEEARVRGVQLNEPWLLRVVGGAELHTLSTGLDEGVTAILPPSPLQVDRAVAVSVLGTAAPVEVVLVEHGPAARRRCFLRGIRPPLLLGAIALTTTAIFDWPWWPAIVGSVVLLALGVLAGLTAYSHLGHALTQDHLVSGDGVFDRVRTVLERDGTIGWVVSQNWFQRRVGLATLVATTAAGAERVVVRDVPLPRAIALADATTPRLLTEFLA